MSEWDARQYLQFEAQRTRPAADLLTQVGGSAHDVVDLGCGPGNSTELLVARYPGARVTGLDSSDDMLAKARQRLPNAVFEKGDVATWRAATAPDLFFANALMQWIPHHISVMIGLVGQLAAGGRLAVQVPDNLDEPSHVLMRDIAASAPFAGKIGHVGAAREKIGAFDDYYRALAPHCPKIDLWRTTYAHLLPEPAAIVEWVKGTALRPFLAPLSPEEKEEFLARYGAAIAKAYPPMPDGRALLPFPRLFIVAEKSASAFG